MAVVPVSEARTAHDGLEAQDVAALCRPDLLLLDIGMPRLNGHETARCIRQQPWGKGVVLVALTGWGQEDRRKSGEAGFDSHMVKPVEPVALEKLLATPPGRTRLEARNMQTIELADGGLLLYDEAFLPPDLAERYFVELRDTAPWERKKAAFGHWQPRLTASYGDDGTTYFYSGTENRAAPWTPTLLEIKLKIEAVRGRYNYCLLNRYRSGQDSVGMHADDEPGMGDVIGSLSLGATRVFRIRHNKTKETRTFQLSSGTLVIMAGTMQQFWKHEVPKTTEDVGERINLTFRHIRET